MKPPNNAKQSKQKKEYATWSNAQKFNFLEFLIVNHHKLQNRISSQTIDELRKYVNRKKTNQNVYNFFWNLKKKHRSHKEIVEFLAKDLKVDKKWIMERTKSSNYLQAKDFQSLFDPIENFSTFEADALKILLRTLNPFQLEIEVQNSSAQNTIKEEANDPQDITSNQFDIVDLKPEKLQLIQLNQIRPNLEGMDEEKDDHQQTQTQQVLTVKDEGKEKRQTKEANNFEINRKKKPVAWGQVSKLRFLVFLIAYKQHFKKDRQGVFVKMSRFITNKTNDQCYDYFYKKCREVNLDEKVECLIEKLKDQLYVNSEQVEKEVKSVMDFYESDYRKQLNSVLTKSCLIEEISQNILQKICENWKNNGWNQSTQNQNGQKIQLQESIVQQQNEEDFNSQKKADHQVLIPIKLTLILRQEQSEQKFKRSEQQKNFEVNWYGKDILKHFQFSHHEISKIRPKSFKDSGILFVPSRFQQSQKNLFESDYRMADQTENQFSFPNQKLFDQHEQQRFQIQSVTIKENNLGQSFQDFKQSSINIPQNCNQGISSVKQTQQIKEAADDAHTSRKVKKKLIYWTVSQHMKFMLYLIINNKKLPEVKNQPCHKVWTKLVNYIGTDKTAKHCKDHFHQYKSQNGGSIDTLIEKEGKRLGIRPELIYKRIQICQKKNTFTIQDESWKIQVDTFPVTVQKTTNLKESIKSILQNDLPIQVKMLIPKSHDFEKVSHQIDKTGTGKSGNYYEPILEEKPAEERFIQMKITLAVPSQAFLTLNCLDEGIQPEKEIEKLVNIELILN